MNDIAIRPISTNEDPPYDLLLEADPLQASIDDYWSRGMGAVAEQNGKLVGVYVLIHTRPFVMELVNIAVATKLRGHGIGKQLVEHAIQLTRTCGAKTLEVGTGNSSLDQLAFYQRCGFRIVGIDRDFFVKHYPEPIIENHIRCLDMVRLSMEL